MDGSKKRTRIPVPNKKESVLHMDGEDLGLVGQIMSLTPRILIKMIVINCFAIILFEYFYPIILKFHNYFNLLFLLADCLIYLNKALDSSAKQLILII